MTAHLPTQIMQALHRPWMCIAQLVMSMSHSTVTLSRRLSNTTSSRGFGLLLATLHHPRSRQSTPCFLLRSFSQEKQSTKHTASLTQVVRDPQPCLCPATTPSSASRRPIPWMVSLSLPHLLSARTDAPTMPTHICTPATQHHTAILRIATHLPRVVALHVGATRVKHMTDQATPAHSQVRMRSPRESLRLVRPLWMPVIQACLHMQVGHALLLEGNCICTVRQSCPFARSSHTLVCVVSVLRLQTLLAAAPSKQGAASHSRA